MVAAEYSPDGSHLITASWDGTAKLWLRATGAEVASFGGHADRLTAARFAPDGSVLVTAARDRWVRIWPYDLSRLIEQGGRKR